jgi:hypothetical protein
VLWFVSDSTHAIEPTRARQGPDRAHIFKKNSTLKKKLPSLKKCVCLIKMTCLFTITACEHPSWINDRICDDLSNTEECQFDGGDCCLVDQTITKVCIICLCHETGLYYTVAPGGICIVVLSSVASLACLMLLFH